MCCCHHSFSFRSELSLPVGSYKICLIDPLPGLAPAHESASMASPSKALHLLLAADSSPDTAATWQHLLIKWCCEECTRGTGSAQPLSSDSWGRCPRRRTPACRCRPCHEQQPALRPPDHARTPPPRSPTIHHAWLSTSQICSTSTSAAMMAFSGMYLCAWPPPSKHLPCHPAV